MNAVRLLHVPTDQRLKPRKTRLKTVMLVARVLAGDRDDLCRVRNISEGGMCIVTLAPLRVAQQIRIEFKNGMTIEPTVKWVGKEEAGLQFNEPIEIEQLLAAPNASAGNPLARIPRGPRLSAQCPVALRRQGHIGSGTLENISQGGAQLRSAVHVEIDDMLQIIVPGLGSIKATVRRVSGTSAGLTFCDKLGFSELATWLAGEERFSAYQKPPSP